MEEITGGDSSEQTSTTSADTDTEVTLVTGASGLIGSQFTKALSTKSHSVVSVYRHRLPNAQENVFPFCSNLSSSQLLLAPLRGVKTVVHLAWEKNFRGPTESLPDNLESAILKSDNLQALKNLIDAMEVAKTNRLIFLSATGASSKSPNMFLKEKYFAELMILNSNIEERIILRCDPVWRGDGNEDPFLQASIRLLKYPLYPTPNSKQSAAPVHVSDVVGVLKKIVETNESVRSGIVQLRSNQSLDSNDILKKVAHDYMKQNKMPIKTIIGGTLFNLLDRPSDEQSKTARFQDYYRSFSEPEGGIDTNNPLAKFLPENPRSFLDTNVN